MPGLAERVTSAGRTIGAGLRNYENGMRNGFGPRRAQTAEGQFEIEIPQVREAAETFASNLLPRTHCAPGLIKAIEHCWPASDRQRCCVHRARNLYAKLPESERERVKHAYWQALDDAINERDAKDRLQALVDELDKGGFTAAAKCLADDLDALVVHLRYPARHRRRWRSTNLLERSLGEVKRRTKVMGRFPGETSCLTLVWAVLDLLITHQTNGIHFNALDRQRLKRMRYAGNEQTIPEEVAAA